MLSIPSQQFESRPTEHDQRKTKEDGDGAGHSEGLRAPPPTPTPRELVGALDQHSRSTLCQHKSDRENLKSAEQSREYDKPRQRSEQRKSDPPESSPCGRAIDTRRIDVNPRDALESGEEHQRLAAHLRVERERSEERRV